MPSANNQFLNPARQLYRAESIRKHELKAGELVGIDADELIQRAGQASYDELQKYYAESDNLLVLVGSGHNAADGFVLAGIALQAGKEVTLCAVKPAKELSPNVEKAKQFFLRSGGAVHEFAEWQLNSADVIIDAMVGTGVDGPVHSTLAAIISAVNHANIPVVSLDVPSGLQASTGAVLGPCIRADLTITFVAIKTGLVTGEGKDYVGKLVLAPLGLSTALPEVAKANASFHYVSDFKGLPKRRMNTHKGQNGRLLCIGGNEGMSGAIRMSSEAALRTGTGLVKCFVHPQSRVQISSGLPELMVITQQLTAALEWANAIVIGPGLGTDQWGQDTFSEVVAFCQQHDKPLVMDADALTLLSTTSSFPSLERLVITPHSGEAARLLNLSVQDLDADRFNSARQCAQRYDAICVLKGAGTIIDNGKAVGVCAHGNPGMATAGMGDVLTGTLGSMIAQKLSIDEAVRYGVCVHARAADRIAEQYGERGILATDLIPELRLIINGKVS